MSKILAPVCKLCRRESVKLFLKGDKCYTKCILERRPQLPGRSAKMKGRRRKTTDYGVRLREKQQLKRMLLLNEAQMKRYYTEAQRLEGRTGENMLHLLELRLDNVLRRAGVAVSPRFARQLVGHGHVRVNGRRITSSSYAVRPGDNIELSPKMKANFFIQLSRQGQERRGASAPNWLTWDREAGKGQILRLPEKGEVSFPVNDQYIVEFYTRR